MAKQGHLADESAQGRIRAEFKTLEKQAEVDTHKVMDTPFGRRFVYDLLHRRCNLTGDASSERENGQRSVAVRLLYELQGLCPKSCLLMVAEATEERMKLFTTKQDAEASAKVETDE